MEQTELPEPTGEWLFIAPIKRGILILSMEQTELPELTGEWQFITPIKQGITLRVDIGKECTGNADG